MSFVVKAVKGVVKAVGNIITGVVKAIGNVVSAVVNFVASPFMGLFGMPDAPSDAAEAERQQGVLLQKSGSNVNIPVVYGYRKVGGIVDFAETGSDNNRYLWVVYTLCEGPIEGLHELYIDDNQLDESIISPLNEGRGIEIKQGKYKDRVRLQFINVPYYYRNLDQHPIIGNHICRNAPSWEDSMIYNGVTLVMARYEWKEIKTQEDADNNPFSGNIPKLQATIMGRRVASLVTTTSEQYAYQASGYKERYSTNPAEILLDYLRNPRYGKGLTNDEIDWDSWRIAAAKCNTEVEYVNGLRGPILTTNVVVDTASTLFNNTKLLLTNMRGYMPYVQGKYKLKIEDAGHPTDILSGQATIYKTFTKDNIIGNITYTGVDRSAKYTQVVVKYVDPDNKWSVQEVVWPESDVVRQSYINEDNGRENSTEITFSACTNYAIAKDFARMIFQKSRWQDSLSFRADSSAFDLEPGDNIYVNANILKFNGPDKVSSGDIPWRIVSIKLNNDYTFDIGCVRNEDYLYPHTKVGEQDIVLPPYIPKGAEIFYPDNPYVYPRGIIPPTRSPHPGIVPDPVPGGGEDEDIIPILPGPPPRDPDDPDGGGNGSPGGDNNDGNNPNDPPPPPPPVYKFNDVIDITNVQYSLTPGSAATDATFTFTQPDHPQYSGIDIWYKIASNRITTYRHAIDTTLQGAGEEISFTLPNLKARTSHELIVRVNYSTGEASTGKTTSYFFPEPGTSADVTEGESVVRPGWELPEREPNNRRDTYIEAISAQTLLSNGNTRDPRQISVTLRQFTAGLLDNDQIKGVDCYFKPSSLEYWYKRRHNFNNSYVQGDDYTFQFPDNLGSQGSLDKYDFIFRFVYQDGTQSKYQARLMNCDVESNGITNDFDPFEGKQMAANGKELVSDYALQTTDEDPIDVPGVDPRTFVITRNSLFPINPNSPVPSFRVVFNDDFADPEGVFQGVRVAYRSLARGANNKAVTVNYVPIERNSSGDLEIRFPINFEENYEYVITPLVRYLNSTVECNQSWYGRGAMTRFRNIDYWQVLNFKLEDTNVAKRRLSDTRTIDPADPTLQILKFEKIDLTSQGGRDPASTYYRLEVNYSEISGFQGINIYRRTKAFASQINDSTYYGWGRWEKIEDTRTSVDETLIFNLRMGIFYQEFNQNNVLVNPLYSTNKPVHPIGWDEFIVTVVANGQESSKAYYLQGQFLRAGDYRFDLLNANEVEVVDPADYNNYSAASDRNLDDARAPISGTTTLIKWPNKTAGGWSLPTPIDGPTVI